VGTRSGELGPTPTLALEDGPGVTAQVPIGRGLGNLQSVLRLPRPCWAWWAERQRTDADALLLCCTDAEAGQYTVRTQRRATLDASGVAAANRALRDAAATILRRRSRLRADELVRKLLAYGVYHRTRSAFSTGRARSRARAHRRLDRRTRPAGIPATAQHNHCRVRSGHCRRFRSPPTHMPIDPPATATVRSASGRYGASSSILPTNSGRSVCPSIWRMARFSPVWYQ
jgi:hypothetical protein